jgi:hypothetical protein
VLIAPPGVELELQHAFMGGAWWTLLHELGHFELGHMTRAAGSARPSIRGELVLAQALSPFQLEEFAADDFAFDSLGSDGKKLAYGWASHALAPSMMLETLTASQGSATHPLCINRLDRARMRSDGLDPAMEDLHTGAHLRQRARAHLSIGHEYASIRSLGDQPMFEDWPVEALHAALGGLRGLFELAGFDLGRFQASTFGWRNLAIMAPGPTRE